MSLFLFYLLVLFLPSQLGRHFFFNFSQVSGIVSDYLTPTIYFTDIIAILLIITVIPNLFRNPLKMLKQVQHDTRTKMLSLFFCYLLFNVLFVSASTGAAFYKFAKITEFMLLGIAISRLKPKFATIIYLFSISVFYSSVIAIWQFVSQKSIGGIFWFLGERTFYADTPGIAALSLNGNLMLRPYATFPHPNVLGGFLAVILPVIFYFVIKNRLTIKKTSFYLLLLCLLVGITSLILTFSKLAWFTSLIGIIFVFLELRFGITKKFKPKNDWIFLAVFYLLISLSIVIPLVLPEKIFEKSQYWQERVDLIKTTIPLVSENMLFGVGLNNSIVQLRNYTDKFPGLYIYQPVHNIFLLVLSEIGIWGFILFMYAFVYILHQRIKQKHILIILLAQLFFLGLFDHYVLTLQQGQLLAVIFTSLYLMQKVAYL